MAIKGKFKKPHLFLTRQHKNDIHQKDCLFVQHKLILESETLALYTLI